MIDVRVSRPLAKPVGTRREIRRHLDCLTRQIAVRAGRQATTVRVRSRARRRSGVRLYRQELVNSLTFERWSEVDTLAYRLAAREQVIDELQHSSAPRVPPCAG